MSLNGSLAGSEGKTCVQVVILIVVEVVMGAAVVEVVEEMKIWSWSYKAQK